MSKSIRIKKSSIQPMKILYFVLVASFFEPAWFGTFRVIDTLYGMLKVAAFLYGIIWLWRKKKIPSFLLAIFGYLFILMLSTIVNWGVIYKSITEMIISFGAPLIIYIMFQEFPNASWNIMTIIYEFLIYGNFISVLYAPNGLYKQIQASGWWTDKCWFLGIRNGMTLTYVIGAFILVANVYIHDGDRKSWIRCLLFYAVSTYTIISINAAVFYQGRYTSSGGLTIVWAILLIYLLLMRFHKVFKWLNFSTAIIINIALFLILVVFKAQYLFSYIIVTLLKKDLTMTGRTRLWNRAIELIKAKPVLGYGIEDGKIMASRFQDSAAVNTSQNGLLDVLYYGGIILFIALIVVLYVVGKYTLKKVKDDRLTFCIGYFTFAYFLGTQGESIGTGRLFILMSLIYCLSQQYTRVYELQPATTKQMKRRRSLNWAR